MEEQLRLFCFACRELRADVGEPHPEGPCPKCGNDILAGYPPGQELKLTAGGFEIRSTPPRGGRWQAKSKSKHEIFRKTQRKHFVHRVIDRISNWYHERIVDVETGEVVHEVSEPLTDHQGHGSARRAKPSDSDPSA